MCCASWETSCGSAGGVGTREAYLAIRSDDQLENRFEPVTLPLWEADADLLSLLASFGSSFRCVRARIWRPMTWPATS
ncbi:TniB family NTP-binding protein [Arthrobacter crystallopoietes]|uniref:TniB family NTP-binding protein n=1 Tax=Crystallibacter crystallopoietes TaxID=37928 RepID=UPI003CC7A2AB